MEKTAKQQFIECLLKLRNDSLLMFNSNLSSNELKLDFGDYLIAYNPAKQTYTLNSEDWDGSVSEACTIFDSLDETFVLETIGNYYYFSRKLKGKKIPFVKLIDKFKEIIYTINEYQKNNNLSESEFGIFTKYYVFKVIEENLVYCKKPITKDKKYDIIDFEEVMRLNNIDYIDMYDALNITYENLKKNNIV